MTPRGSGPRSTAVRRARRKRMSRPRPRPDSVRRRPSHSSAVADVRGPVRLRAAHLLVAVRLGEWRDDALACLPAGAGSGGPTVPNDEARVCLLYTSDAADDL